MGRGQGLRRGDAQEVHLRRPRDRVHGAARGGGPGPLPAAVLQVHRGGHRGRRPRGDVDYKDPNPQPKRTLEERKAAVQAKKSAMKAAMEAAEDDESEEDDDEE